MSFGGVFFLPRNEMNPPFGRGAEEVNTLALGCPCLEFGLAAPDQSSRQSLRYIVHCYRDLWHILVKRTPFQLLLPPPCHIDASNKSM